MRIYTRSVALPELPTDYRVCVVVGNEVYEPFSALEVALGTAGPEVVIAKGLGNM